MRRIALILLAAISVWTPGAAARSNTSVVSESVSFSVLHAGQSATVKGRLYLPSQAKNCTNSVMLLIHAVATGAYVWDFPYRPERYAVAPRLAEAGYAVVAVDLLGYGASDHPDGRMLTSQAHAVVVAQIADQLRAATYHAASPRSFRHVGVVGSSAGAAIAEHVAGGLADVDALVVIAWTHFPSQQAGQRFTREEIPRAASSSEAYYEFGGEKRSSWFFNPTFADPEVVARDGQLAGLAPTGHVLSIPALTSRAATAAVRAPVLLVLGTGDFIFPTEFADDELALFVSSVDRTTYLAADAGHAVLLHPNAPETTDAIIAWMAERSNAIPRCASG